MHMADPLQDNIDRVVRRSELESLTYTDESGSIQAYPIMGQGPAKPATADELARDELGFTHSNLHRRVDPHDPPVAENPLNQEVAPRSYQIGIQNVHSYRTTQINVHDEESIDCEIP